MTFKEWWDRAMGDYVIIDDYLDAYRAGQSEMRERAAEEFGDCDCDAVEVADGVWKKDTCLRCRILALPLEGDDE